MEVIHACKAELPGRKQVTPDKLDLLIGATDERLDNTRVSPSRGLFVMRAVIERLKLWQTGRTLRIKFMDGDPTVQAKVREVADQWTDVVNLVFEWVAQVESADIRISFADVGSSWSYVGTDALSIPSHEATMNYGWLGPNTDPEEYQRVVMHEFGHALGLHHEHQSPVAGIPWDKEAVYAWYAEGGWSREDVDYNVFYTLSGDVTNYSEYDRHSIMHYAVPNELTIGDFEVGWNTSLSPIDIEFMRSQYPPTEVVPVSLEVGGERTSGEIGAEGEIDTYTFWIKDVGTYILSTEGPTDTVVSVFGPNDQGALVTWDDDRGKLTNARIVKKLFPGTYWATVQHKDATSTGGYYNIGIKRRK